jgi:hypothetical protein
LEQNEVGRAELARRLPIKANAIAYSARPFFICKHEPEFAVEATDALRELFEDRER